MKKKIIFLTSRFPYPLEKGDKLRAFHQIKGISKKYNIYLISINTESRVKYEHINILKKYCKEVYILDTNKFSVVINLFKSFILSEPLQTGYFYSTKNQKKINEIIKKTRPDWIYSQLIRTSKYTQNFENNFIDYMDAMSIGIKRRISNFPIILKPFIRREFIITKRYESEIFNKFRKHSIITQNDQNFIDNPLRKKINIIPNGVDTKYFFPISKNKKSYDIIFIGNMSYPPNIEAAIFLCKKIKPLIDKEYKLCKILIGGTNPTKKIKNLENEQIHVSGRVEDIRNLYSIGKVFIAPMFIGSGLQNKLLEAMAMGIPCITTELANKALRANKHQITIAKNEGEFARLCIRLLKNKDLYNSFRDEGLKFIKKTYDWKKINNKLIDLFE